MMIDATAHSVDVPRPGHGPMRLRRIGPFLLIGQLAWAVPGTAGATLLQSLADDIDPANKVRTVAVIAAVGAVTSAIGTVAGGRLSDRTRSRIGRRKPWLLGSSILATLALVGCGMTSSQFAIGVLFAVFQLGIGTWTAALSALIPDHVASSEVGRASSFAGLGFLVGQTLGGVLAGVFVTHPARGLAVVPWVMVAGAILMAIYVPAEDNRSAPPPVRSASGVRSWIPSASPDFWLAFTGRFLFILAVVMITHFKLYMFTDYLGLSKKDAGTAVAVGITLVGAFSVVTTVAGGVLSDRLGRKKIFVGGAPLLLAAGMVPVLAAPSTTTVYFFCVAIGLTLGTYLAVDQALMVAVLPDPDTAARDLGVLGIGSTLPGVVAPVVGGALINTMGYNALFLVSLVLAAAAAVVIIFIRSVR
ncbi:MFS transporter [Streptomyces sp. NBC_00038]|uniref:MFS transporter n=1 Tax=Streptomyces sp. NBC_00038 TaxID=2903615 RepID=UPI0022564465|nr:MFS transporter [Streptomyces sp. NBC_00038]MCX5554528.1 MFS transporter [Streptomyces sp. NBC_00038]